MTCPSCRAVNDFTIPSGSLHTGRQELSQIDLIPPPALDSADAMVYVICEIGGIATEMMVDTGAESSVISWPLVQRLNLADRLDRSRQGVASGVGTAKIIGRLREVPVKLGHVEF